MIFLRAMWKRRRAFKLREHAEHLLRRAFGMKEQARALQKQADDLDVEVTLLEMRGRERAR